MKQNAIKLKRWEVAVHLILMGLKFDQEASQLERPEPNLEGIVGDWNVAIWICDLQPVTFRHAGHVEAHVNTEI